MTNAETKALVASVSAARKAALDEALATIPQNWCDELLTGKGSKMPLDCPGVERLLNGVRARILKLKRQHGPEGGADK